MRSFLCTMLALSLATAAAATPAEIDAAFKASDAQVAADSEVRIVRFQSIMTGEFPRRQDGVAFKPAGRVLLPAGSDPILGSEPAPYITEIHSNSDGKGGFTDTGSIRFAGGELRFTAVYPTRNIETPLPGMRTTAMVEKVTGGTGAFEGASGYIMQFSTIDGDGFRTTLNGILFVRKMP
ncbi:hypothetical protein [Phenylobacterium sp.]|jgi:hypothetical protein|uniref:hypothetical protein n=1 Tax=Phenylobacterium sp. TaxID=1871053 RepID=UPI00378350CD